jgi:hypothetical protein
MGGRAKGTPNRRTQDIQEKLARIGCDPIRGMAEIALNRLPCGVCRGELKTKYLMPQGNHTTECRTANSAECTCEGIGTRICQSCYGSGWEACSPELRGKMYAEIAQYVLPKRKAIEHSGIDGDDIGVRLVVEFKE